MCQGPCHTWVLVPQVAPVWNFPYRGLTLLGYGTRLGYGSSLRLFRVSPGPEAQQVEDCPPRPAARKRAELSELRNAEQVRELLQEQPGRMAKIGARNMRVSNEARCESRSLVVLSRRVSGDTWKLLAAKPASQPRRLANNGSWLSDEFSMTLVLRRF